MAEAVMSREQVGLERAGEIIAAYDIRVIREGKAILAVPGVTVREGEVLAVVGPNGAGKSTLLMVLACLEFPKTGRVFFRGDAVTRKNAVSVRRRMSVVFQEPLLLDGTVLENVEMGLRLRGLGRVARGRALEWVSRFGLTGKENQAVHTLSGGEARRVSLARAFAVDPQVLLLDEPFSSVDAAARQELLGDLEPILRETGITAVLVTHDFSEVMFLATRVIVLNRGRIEAEGTPDSIANDPRWRKMAGSRC